MTEHVEKTTLHNGVRVLSERMEGIRSVSIGVLVNAGSKDERADERGYAHLLEHMIFQGTGDRDAAAIAEMMAIGGGAMGAFTTRDYTVYHATMLDEYLPFALEVLGDMLCNSVIPADALDTQRSVIMNEIAGNEDPIRLANDLLKMTLWPNHSLGFPTAGLERTLDEATRESLLDFMRRRYVADQLVVVAAGNVQHADFVEQVGDSFWQMPEAESELHQPVSPEANWGTIVARQSNISQVYFTMAWPAPNYTSLDRYGWHVFSNMLGGGTTSRLYRRLREERGLVYHVEAQYQAYGNAGALVVEGGTRPQTLVPVLAGALMEVMGMSMEPLDPDRHHQVVQSLISQHLVSGDSAYVRMSRLALQELYFGEAVSSQQVIDDLRAQSPEAIQRAAASVAGAGLPVISLVGPVSQELLAQVSAMLSDFGELRSASFVEEDKAPVPVSISSGLLSPAIDTDSL